MAAWAGTPLADAHWRRVTRDLNAKGAEGNARGIAAEALRRAGLFFVEPDMAKLAAHAAKSLPDLTLEPRDLPAPCGVLYSPEPIFIAGGGANRIHGAAWAPCPLEGGGYVGLDGQTVPCTAIWLAYLVDRDAHLSRMSAAARREWSRGWLPRLHHLNSAGVCVLEHSDRQALEETHARGYDTHPLQVLKAAWVLMQQEGLVRETEAGPARAARKRLLRDDVAEDAMKVRVFALRRPTHPPPGAGMSDREYQHQWIVRGHWRNQPYKTQGVTRPIWIAPHIKGPEGAPLLGGERVLHWKQ